MMGPDGSSFGVQYVQQSIRFAAEIECPMVDTVDGAFEIEGLSLQLEINGELRQDGGYQLMMHKPEKILREIQQFMSLEDDDVIMTGTPEGVGQVTAGDRFVGRIKIGDEVLVSREWLAG